MYVCVYVGADNIMLPLCTVSNDVAQLQSVNKSLDDLSNMGLRSHAYMHTHISTYIYDIHIRTIISLEAQTCIRTCIQICLPSTVETVTLSAHYFHCILISTQDSDRLSEDFK
jgi:hypothetical protein